jgi:DNA repair protein RecO
MSHHIYTTEGFVLNNFSFGEGNSYFYIFTKDLGLVGASARSVREIKSKLRYGLQDFCHSTISLVRGKHEWKITSALPNKNFYYRFIENKDKFLVCANILSLLKKLVTGEEKNEKLFDIIRSGMDFLDEEVLSKEEVSLFECILMLRIVSNLGYLAPDSELKYFSENIFWNKDMVLQMQKYKKKAVFEINRSIKESQL